jgi:hypothetical protein
VVERLKNALRVLAADHRLDTLAMYPATVLKDHGDGKLDVQPDRSDLPALVRIPLRTFLPGVQVEVQPDSRVLVGFENGQATAPYVQLFESGSLRRLTVSAEVEISLIGNINLGGTGGEGVALNGFAVSVEVPAGAFLMPNPSGPPLPNTPMSLTGTITQGSATVKGVA